MSAGGGRLGRQVEGLLDFLDLGEAVSLDGVVGAELFVYAELAVICLEVDAEKALGGDVHFLADVHHLGLRPVAEEIQVKVVDALSARYVDHTSHSPHLVRETVLFVAFILGAGGSWWVLVEYSTLFE